MSTNKLIQTKLELLPTSPGCYIHKDKNGTIIYVGKAKNLRNRVRSYFRGSHDTKTEALVSEIEDFEFIVTESNIEALLLEINLIKENKPKYNIMLKDDKSYPFIKITNEVYPRLIITRQVKKDGGLYFGPYPDVGAANEIKRLLAFLHSKNVPIHLQKSVFIITWGNVKPIRFASGIASISRIWLRKCRIFSRDRTIRLSMSSVIR